MEASLVNCLPSSTLERERAIERQRGGEGGKGGGGVGKGRERERRRERERYWDAKTETE